MSRQSIDGRRRRGRDQLKWSLKWSNAVPTWATSPLSSYIRLATYYLTSIRREFHDPVEKVEFAVHVGHFFVLR